MQFLNLCKFKPTSIYLFIFKLYMEHLISDHNYKGKMMQDLAIPMLNFVRFVLTYFSGLWEGPSIAGPSYALSSTLPNFVLSKELLRVNAAISKSHRIIWKGKLDWDIDKERYIPL